jgi:alkylation response protein AidB-like acyl-CoA dehydrogenase
MDLRLPAEFDDLRTLVRRFVAEHLLPHEAALERDGGLPAEVWADLEGRSRALGLNALGVPAEHGGAGLDTLGQLVAAEEMGRIAVGFRHIVGTPAGAPVVAAFGTPEQHRDYLQPWLAGERWGAWAATEPGAGSDLGAMTTVARRDGAGWVLSGGKHFVTGLDRADFVITFAKTTRDRGVRGLTAFLVDLDTPGVTRGREQVMMGRGGLRSFELHYDDVALPDGARLGAVDGGFALLIRDVSRMRLLLAGHCLGVTARLLDLAAGWGRSRVQFGRPIGEFGALQWSLADTAAELVTVRAATYQAAALVDAGYEARAESATAKAFASELAFRAADRTLQIFGGSGYCRDLPVEALFRAVRLWRIAEGTSEIQRMLVGRELDRGWRPGAVRIGTGQLEEVGAS